MEALLAQMSGANGRRAGVRADAGSAIAPEEPASVSFPGKLPGKTSL
jgi:hypothetical protein